MIGIVTVGAEMIMRLWLLQFLYHSTTMHDNLEFDRQKRGTIFDHPPLVFTSGFITEGSFWNMAVPEGIDFYYEITQWESGMIFHYRYLLDGNNNIVREKRFDQATSFEEEIKGDKGGELKKGNNNAYKVQVKEKAKTVDPQVGSPSGEKKMRSKLKTCFILSLSAKRLWLLLKFFSFSCRSR